MPELSFKSFFWSGFGQVGGILVAFATNLVFTRILKPEIFGLISVLNVFLAFAFTSANGGLTTAIIQRADLREAHLNAAFIWNSLMALLLYGGLFLLAPVVAEFYSTPELCPVLRAIALCVPIRATSLVHYALMLRTGELKRLSLLTLTSSIIAAPIGIIYAYYYGDVWSLVLYTVLVDVINTLLYWSQSKWRPRYTVSWAAFKEIFSFGGYMYLSTLSETIYHNIQGAIVGKLFNKHSAGIYYQARKLQDLPVTVVDNTINQVLYPYSSSKQHDKTALRNIWQGHISALSWIGWPCIGLMVLVGPTLIPLLYGNQWDATIPIFRILCVGGLFYLLSQANFNIIKAKGQGLVFFGINLLFFASMLSAIIFLSSSLLLLAVLVAASNLVLFLASTFVCAKRDWRLALGNIATTLESALVTLPLLLMDYYCVEGLGIEHPIGKIALQSVLFLALIYPSYIWIIKPKSFMQIRHKIKERLPWIS